MAGVIVEADDVDLGAPRGLPLQVLGFFVPAVLWACDLCGRNDVPHVQHHQIHRHKVHSFRYEQVFGEGPFLIDPLRFAEKTRVFGDL